MGKNPSFLFYASDFLTDTTEFEAESVGVYIRLLCTQWVNGDLPEDLKKLAKIGGVSFDRMNIIWKELAKKFVKKEDGRLVNPKLEEVRREKLEFMENASDFGKKGAEMRWKKKENGVPYSIPHEVPYGVAHENPNGVSMALHASTSSSNKDNNQEEVFDKARKLYPGSKRGLDTELKELKKHKDWKEVIPILEEKITAQIQAKEKKKAAGEFVPSWKNFKTWLYQRCWEEEIETTQTPKPVIVPVQQSITMEEYNQMWGGVK